MKIQWFLKLLFENSDPATQKQNKPISRSTMNSLPRLNMLKSLKS